MPRLLLANIALCSTIAQAITTKLLMMSLQDAPSSAVPGLVSTLEGYADSAEVAALLAKAESDHSNTLLTSAQNSQGDASTLLDLLNGAKSNAADATTHYGTASAAYDQSTSLVMGDLATAVVAETNQASTSMTDAISNKADLTGAFATAAGHVADAGTAEDEAKGYRDNAQAVVDQIQAMIDLNLWLADQSTEATGCETTDADVNLVHVDGVFRIFIGSNCPDPIVNHVYFHWRWSPNTWDKIKDNIVVSSGFQFKVYEENNAGETNTTVEMLCPWPNENEEWCQGVFPAGGDKKIGIQFPAEDLDADDMVSKFLTQQKWFFA